MPFSRRIGERLIRDKRESDIEKFRSFRIKRRGFIPKTIRKKNKINLKRDPKRPYDRHLTPDFEGSHSHLHERRFPIRDLQVGRLRPLALPGAGFTAHWNSVALFFNLDMPAADWPAGYASTSVTNARKFMDEGDDALNPGISESLCNYWGTLSQGNFAFGLDTPRNSSNQPLIPSIEPPGGDPFDWGQLIRKCIEANPVAVWEAAGQLTKDGKRWIPSVVLIQNYNIRATAHYGGFDMTIGGHEYRIGDFTHIQFSLSKWSPDDAPSKTGRRWWGTLNHEYGHNFLEFGDLYGPSGCTGYWDLLGDNTPPGRMSEISSVQKERLGWISFKQVYNGPNLSRRELSLNPYTTSGEAYKIVPDPTNTPHEYFLLEYRKATGNEVWRPDGGLPEEGLMITHINERLGIPSTWLLREAPYFNPEFADATARSFVDWRGHDDLTDKLFPQGTKNSFTPSTMPSSDLYGPRPSGLRIENIRISGGKCRFSLQMNGSFNVGWTTSSRDTAIAGRFTNEALVSGEEIFMRNDNAAALLSHGEGQWTVQRRQEGWIGGWNLGRNNRQLSGDLDGDGLDEIFIRSPEWAGVIKWSRGRFRTVTVQHDWIGEWNLGNDNYEHLGDFDGDEAAEIYIRSPNWAGIMKLEGNRLVLKKIHHDWIDGWNLGAHDKEFVGRFSTSRRDEIMIRSPEWMGLLKWNNRRSKLELAGIQNDWIDGWNMGPNDWHAIGDFDNDGKDEIFIRSAQWAGVLKWVSGRFRVLWMTQTKLNHINGEDDSAYQLKASDRLYSGRFRAGKDGILLRDSSRALHVLSWEGGEMKVVKSITSRFNGRWNLGLGDKFVLGDFHRFGNDIADTHTDTVIDGLTDIFIHNGWGTGMVGVNHGEWRPGDILDQIGLTWMQQSKIMMQD